MLLGSLFFSWFYRIDGENAYTPFLYPKIQTDLFYTISASSWLTYLLRTLTSYVETEGNVRQQWG
jgi:hypothetical protein